MHFSNAASNLPYTKQENGGMNNHWNIVEKRKQWEERHEKTRGNTGKDR